MALFDLGLSSLLVIGYAILYMTIEQLTTASLFVCLIFVLLLYKIASLPIAYLVSLAANSKIHGFLFIFLIYYTIAWVFTIHLKTFIEWTMFSFGYLYTIATWTILLVPLASMIEALTVINQINRIDQLCPKIPAYTATSNLVNLEPTVPLSFQDSLIAKVRECLASGKRGISVDVINQSSLGILWDIYLMLLFGAIVWLFLLFSERVFGIIARRFDTSKSTEDPLKAVIRSSEPTHSLFKWDREKDRLVSEYIRSLNETKFVKSMSSNCVYLRIWLKPMCDQTSLDKRLALILEPLLSIGLPRNEISVELKTTLQIFIRLGTESSKCKVDRIKLIEVYTKFLLDHQEKFTKFAIIDWRREMLYKILLHGHYNTKSTTISF